MYYVDQRCEDKIALFFSESKSLDVLFHKCTKVCVGAFIFITVRDKKKITFAVRGKSLIKEKKGKKK